MELCKKGKTYWFNLDTKNKPTLIKGIVLDENESFLKVDVNGREITINKELVNIVEESLLSIDKEFNLKITPI